MTVLVITDNDIELCGVESALGRLGLEGHAWDPTRPSVDATPFTGRWGLVLVDVTPTVAGWDRMPAVRWLKGLLPELSHDVRVVGWSCGPLGAAAALRLARAGVTELVRSPWRPRGADIASLHARSTFGGDPVDRCALAAVGLMPASDLDAGLDAVVEMGLEHAFDPGFQVSVDLPRRRSASLRSAFSARAGLKTTGDRYSVCDDRNLSLPTWAEVSRAVNQARGVAPSWDDDVDGRAGGNFEIGVATAS